jgi:uncharacterized protein (DUF1330 family)
MPAYIISRIQITNPEQYKEYMKVTPGAVAKHGGKFIVRGGEVVTLEGPEEKRRLVVIEFPSLEHANTFYRSDDYGAARKLRAGAAVAEFIAVDGVK